LAVDAERGEPAEHGVVALIERLRRLTGSEALELERAQLGVIGIARSALVLDQRAVRERAVGERCADGVLEQQLALGEVAARALQLELREQLIGAHGREIGPGPHAL
jgi:hypothetical protein